MNITTCRQSASAHDNQRVAGAALYCQFFSGALHSPSKFPKHSAPSLKDVLHGANPGLAHDGSTVGYGGLDFADGQAMV